MHGDWAGDHRLTNTVAKICTDSLCNSTTAGRLLVIELNQWNVPLQCLHLISRTGPCLINRLIVPRGESPGRCFISEDHHARRLFGPVSLFADGCHPPDSPTQINRSLLKVSRDSIELVLARLIASTKEN